MSERRIGLFGGTFDPIHFGHLNLAIQMKEYYHLDEVWFCLAKINPHKAEIQSVPANYRLQMLKLALEDLPGFQIIETELKREGSSYTIDTLRELIAEQSTPIQLFLILGEDSASDFFHWREPKEILKLATPLVARRALLENSTHSQGDTEIQEALKKGMTPTRIMEISATEIRQRVHNGLYIGHLVPSKVIDYIYQNHLYCYNSI